MPTQTEAHLLEASWEVCNKVGGIHTVITSKLTQAQDHFGSNYLAIGPYFGSSSLEFKEEEIPADLKEVASTLSSYGVDMHYGSWLVEGKPATILLGWEGLISQLNNYKKLFWEAYQLDTLGSDFYDVDQPLLWSSAVGLFAQEYAKNKTSKVILQAHEWMTGGSILIAKKNAAKLHTVFTTHATVLGRALSSIGVPIYEQLASIKPDEAAHSRGVYTKHQIEKLSAIHATVFTTVSSITAEEATAFLGRKPEVVTENGLNTAAFPTFDQLSVLRQRSRESLLDFISAYFFPSYQFDLTQTTLHFTMGRYEVHNKGYDLYLESLAQLNTKLKAEKSEKTIVSFFLVPADTIGARPEVMNQLIAYLHLRQELHVLNSDQERELFSMVCQNLSTNLYEVETILAPEIKARLRPYLNRLSIPAQPSISPYLLRQGEDDAIIATAHRNGLKNTAEDRVKVVFCPVYFDGFDHIFNSSLYEMVVGCDLGVFPSFYEPWGYTPMESLVMGVPAVTSNLAGFGRSIYDRNKTLLPGLFLLDRLKYTDEHSRNYLTDYLESSLTESPRKWLERRIAAYQGIEKYDWKHLYSYYRKAYQED